MTANPRLARAITMFRQYGAVGFLKRIGARAFSAQHRQYRRAKAREDQMFDASRGVDTGGVQQAYKFAVDGANVGAATPHVASPPDELSEALAAAELPFDDLTFIDLGSGKGRALLLAADLPFRRIIGVEFAKELHATATANFAKLGRNVGSDQRIHLINGDAARFEFPHEPTLLFLYHPFDPPVITDVARNALASWVEAPRLMRVVYLNPVHLEEWLAVGWHLLARSQRFAILGPAKADVRP